MLKEYLIENNKLMSKDQEEKTKEKQKKKFSIEFTESVIPSINSQIHII